MHGALSESTDDQAATDLTTFTLRGRDIKAAARVLRALVDENQEPNSSFAASPQPNLHTSHERSELVERARQTYVNRARRARIFSEVMFGEAAWNMLLALYSTEASGSRQTVSRLAELSGAPQTTALRWLDFLENREGLVRRKPKPTDRRIYMIELTDKARRALDTYFSEVLVDLHPRGNVL